MVGYTYIERPYPKHDTVVKDDQAMVDIFALVPCDQFREHRIRLEFHTSEKIYGNGIVVQEHQRGSNRVENRLLWSRQIEGFHKGVEAGR